MGRGRPRLSTKQKELTGAAAKNPQRLNPNEPQPPTGAPLKPVHLDDLGSEAWDRLLVIFEQMGMLNAADGSLMEAYCVNYSGYRKSLVKVEEMGQALEVETDRGIEFRRNPFSVELHKYMDRMTKLLAEMGLTPSSRSRVVATPKQEDDPFAEWLKRGGLN